MDLKEANHLEYAIEVRHPWEVARTRVICELLRANIPAIFGHSSNIVDMGCGDTFLAEQLSQKMPRATFFAIDIAFNSQDLKQLSLKYRKRPINVFKSLSEYNSSKPIDVLLLLDVIEHIKNDVGFLKEILCHPNITDNTYMLITVPAYDALFTLHDAFLGHYRRYNPIRMKQILNQAGLHTINNGSFFAGLIFFRILKVIKEKLTNAHADNEKGIGGWQPNPFVDPLLQKILILDFQFSRLARKAGIVMPGLSIYSLCKGYAS